MSYVSAQVKFEQKERIRKNMRLLFFSMSTIDSCLKTATGKTLDYIDELFATEAARREASRKANMVKSAGFPSVKNIEDFDFSEVKFPSSISREEVLSLDFIRRKHTLVMHGVCGSGKTMLSIGIGMKACTAGFKVKFLTLSQLSMRLATAAAEGRLENYLISLRKLDLLIIDEFGYTQVDRECSGYLYQVIADSYEQKSLIITTNLPFSEWGKIVTDEQLAAAIIDRIVHYGHSIDTGTKDWRLANSPMNGQRFIDRRRA